jgi:hypothetical protein
MGRGERREVSSGIKGWIMRKGKRLEKWVFGERIRWSLLKMKKKGEGDKESERFAGKKETELRNEEVKSKERKENGYELEGDGGLSKNRPRRTDKKVNYAQIHVAF